MKASDIYKSIKIRKMSSLVLLGVYIILPIFILIHSSSMSPSHIEMAPKCPYMTGEYSVCPISPSIQLDLWKNISMSIVPVFSILFATIAISLFVFFVLHKIMSLLLYIKTQKYRYVHFLYQFLFSQGILNSKAY